MIMVQKKGGTYCYFCVAASVFILLNHSSLVSQHPDCTMIIPIIPASNLCCKEALPVLICNRERCRQVADTECQAQSIWQVHL